MIVAHLIPEGLLTQVTQAPTWGLFVVIVVALYVLSQGADWLIDAATGAAVRMGIPKVVIGATIVSLGTTAPECAVSVLAAWDGQPGLALGNAVGSVIADTALIFGLGCLLVRLPADRFMLNRQGWVQFGTAALLAGICYVEYLRVGDAAAITRPIGLGLLVLLGWYLWQSVRWSRAHTRLVTADKPVDPAATESPAVEIHAPHARHGLAVSLVRGAVGLVMVLVGSEFAITAVQSLAERLGVPEVVISATLVAIGTSTPELVVGMMSIRKGHPELLVGNVIGADILNILFVTGASASAAPLTVVDPRAEFPTVFLALHLPFMLGVLAYFRVCIARAGRQGWFDRWMGWPLVASYVVFVLLSLSVASAG
ncbi:MAG: sodium:calcium antiporter [Planctomycetaceae bacterium]|nr:sodium:calcium antiporter [Planctomycetaceae bacterium]